MLYLLLHPFAHMSKKTQVQQDLRILTRPLLVLAQLGRRNPKLRRVRGHWEGAPCEEVSMPKAAIRKLWAGSPLHKTMLERDMGL